jgi:signal transduction histidine kinase
MSRFFRSLPTWLFAPHPRVTDPEKIQRSWLLSAILFVLILLGTIILLIVINQDLDDIDAPEVQGAFVILGISAVMYVINRLGHNRHAAAGIILPFVVVFTYVAFSSSGKSIFLAFLFLPILLTALFFTLKWTTVMATSILAVLFALLSFQDQVSATSPYWSLRNMWFFLILSTGLLLTFMWHLRNLEEIRQQELKRVNEQLERQVAELERFTYTVSHELRTPLVTVMGFIGSIEEDLQDGKYEKAQKDFPRVTRATKNMHNTLSELLELSRIGRLINPPEEVDLHEVVREALDAVAGRIRSRNINIEVAHPLPAVYGDRPRLREVFENLIDNAAKYTSNQPAPLIEIGYRGGNEPVFYVRDNGMGIEPQYHSRIFRLFEKLDSTSEGTGVGLTLVKRILETHGGEIWVESEGLGKGTAFCFTIPDARAAGKQKDPQIREPGEMRGKPSRSGRK